MSNYCSILAYLAKVSVRDLDAKMMDCSSCKRHILRPWLETSLYSEGFGMVVVSKRLLQCCFHERLEMLEDFIDHVIPSKHVYFPQELHEHWSMVWHMWQKVLHEVNLAKEVLLLLDIHGEKYLSDILHLGWVGFYATTGKQADKEGNLQLLDVTLGKFGYQAVSQVTCIMSKR